MILKCGCGIFSIHLKDIDFPQYCQCLETRWILLKRECEIEESRGIFKKYTGLPKELCDDLKYR